MSEFEWIKYTVFHISDGFEDMRWKKAGSLKYAFAVVILLFFGLIASERLSGFQFGIKDEKTFSVVPYMIKSIVVFSAWTVGNWAVCTLLDGEGTLKNICIYSAYSLVPYTAQLYANTVLSHILISDEQVFMDIIRIVCTCWSAVLIFSAVKAVHRYSVAKTAGTVLLTVFAMFIMLFLAVLFMSLMQQVWFFISSVYTEISYRIRV